MDGSSTERAHLVRKADGYWWPAASKEETFCERVQWDTGSFTGVDGLGEETLEGSVGASFGGWSTLGGGTTLGDGTTLGGVDAVGCDGVVGSLDGGVITVVVVQLLKRSRSLEMANSCL